MNDNEVDKTKNRRKIYSVVYWGFIAFCSVAILTINLIFDFSWNTALWFAILYLLVVGVPFVIVYFASLLPKKFYSHKNKIFFVFKFEKKFYESLGIKKWKDKVPELGKQLSGFDKSKIEKPKEPEYIAIFLSENCKGSFLHFLSLAWGILSIAIAVFVAPKTFVLTIWLPICIVNTFIHYLSFAILRYLRPKLVMLYNSLQKRKEQSK